MIVTAGLLEKKVLVNAEFLDWGRGRLMKNDLESVGTLVDPAARVDDSDCQGHLNRKRAGRLVKVVQLVEVAVSIHFYSQSQCI